MREIIVRPSTLQDAESIGRLAAEFAQYLRDLGDESELNFNAEVYIRDGFGNRPAFSGLVAEEDNELLGYLLYHPGYDVDYATRTLHVIDLYVSENQRGRGVGKALMEEASRVCRHLGGTQLLWSVFTPNKAAIEFYKRLGATFTRDLVFMRLAVGNT